MLAAYLQSHMGVALTLDHHVKGWQTVGENQILGIAIRALIGAAEGDNGTLVTLHSFADAFVIQIGNDETVVGHQFRKAAEGVLNIPQILEEVQMILGNIQQDGHGGEEAKEAVAVFAGYRTKRS